MNNYVIPIFFACDKAYMRHTAVAMLSIITNHNLPGKLKFYIISKDCNSLVARSLERFISKFDIHIEFIDSKYIFDTSNFPIHCKRYTSDIYSRLYIPSIVDGTHEKVLYLDADIVVLGDIEHLYNIDISDNIIGAIPDAPLKNHAERLGLPQANKYFNSGVLLFNTQEWNKHQITQQLVTFIEQNRDTILLPDQDALNSLIGMRWFEITPYWNFQTHAFYLDHLDLQKYLDGEFDLSQVNIVHYTRSSKPWQREYARELDELYIKYRKLTPWPNIPCKTMRFKSYKALLFNTVKAILRYRS